MYFSFRLAFITLTAAMLSLFVRENRGEDETKNQYGGKKTQDGGVKNIEIKDVEKSHQNSGFEMDKPVWSYWIVLNDRKNKNIMFDFKLVSTMFLSVYKTIR